jgi:hypothetical protein
VEEQLIAKKSITNSNKVKKLSKKQGSGKTSLAGATLLREPNRDHEKTKLSNPMNLWN